MRLNNYSYNAHALIVNVVIICAPPFKAYVNIDWVSLQYRL